jgi:hypothetical protein
MEGNGILNRRLDEFSNTSKATLSKYGTEQIQHMYVRRKPIPAAIEKLMKMVSHGKSHRDYDKFFHLSLICNIGSINIIVEKNEEVHVNTEYTQNVNEAEFMKVPYNPARNLNITQLLKNTYEKIGKYNFFAYEAFSINCQRFVADVLQSNYLLNPALKSFIMQPMDEVIKTIPKWSRKLAEITTNVANVVNKIRGGAESDADEPETIYYKKDGTPMSKEQAERYKQLLMKEEMLKKQEKELKEELTTPLEDTVTQIPEEQVPEVVYKPVKLPDTVVAQSFDDMPITLLKAVARHYNSIVKIKNVNKLTKLQLLEEIKSRLEFDAQNNIIRVLAHGEPFDPSLLIRARKKRTKK